MNKTLAALAFCALVGNSSVTFAQCPGLASRVVDAKVDSKDGLFVPTKDMACLLRELEALPLVRDRVRLLEERLVLEGERTSMLKATVGLGSDAMRDLETALQIANRRAVDAESKLTAWYRSPALWAGVGSVFALLVGGVVAFGLGAV